jgi:hypothetical protein
MKSHSKIIRNFEDDLDFYIPVEYMGLSERKNEIRRKVKETKDKQRNRKKTHESITA